MLNRVALTALRRVALTLLAGVGGFSPAGFADDASVQRENQLKAAYVFNFVKFVEWPPAAAGEALLVCFVGGDGVYDTLAAGIESKKAGNRPLALRRLESSASSEGCHALFLSAESLAGGPDPVPLGKSSMLTLSDAKGFARAGGMIEIFTDSNRLRFSVNIDNAQQAGLRISSSLLKLAATIEHGEGK